MGFTQPRALYLAPLDQAKGLVNHETHLLISMVEMPVLTLSLKFKEENGYVSRMSPSPLIIVGCPTSLPPLLRRRRLITCDCPFLPPREKLSIGTTERLRLLSFCHLASGVGARGVRKQPRTAFSGMRLLIHGQRGWQTLQLI